MKLVIAEKPQLGKAIADALPGRGETKDGIIRKGDYVIIWAYGHLLTLKEPEDYDKKYEEWSLEDLPMYFENWGMKVGQNQNKKTGQQSKGARLKQIGELLKQADCVIHAGDIDEEGQLLIDEILRWFSYKGPVWRLDTSNTAEAAMRKALKNMKDNKKCEPDGWSAFGRELSDAIFGFNLTRYFTVKNDVFLPVGRVQTPTLGLVVQRDTLIESHKKTFYYELFAGLSVCNNNVTVKFNPNPENPALTDGKFLNRSYLEQKASELDKRAFPEIVIKKETGKQQPPLPFNLTKLTSYCSKKWGYNPDDVMKITQSLRENHKAITYNRSDCQYLSEEHFKEAPETVKAVAANLGISGDRFDTSIKSKCFNDAKITAHFAIIPTVEKVDITKLTDRERNVYNAVCQYYLVQFMAPALKERTSLNVDLGAGESLKASSTIVLDPGFRSYLMDEIADDEAGEDSDETNELSKIPAGFYQGRVTDTEVKEKETKPPSRYTQASLAADMTRVAKYVDDPYIKQLLLDKDKDKDGENGSIGTSATRPFIITNLIARGYLTEKTEGRRLVLISTPKGRDFYNMLPDSIKKADMTAKWWTIQEDIKLGSATPQQMAKDVLATVTAIISSGIGSLSNAEAYAHGGNGVVLGTCPVCGGSIVETEKAYGCSNKECSCIFFKDNKLLKSVGKRMNATIVKSLISKGRVYLKNCKSAKTGRTFSCDLIVKYGDKYPVLELDFDAEPKSLGTCPVCGNSIIETEKAYSCSNRNCSCAFFKDNRLLQSVGKKMTATIVKSLITKGRATLTDCKSAKTGETFSCDVVVKYGDKYPVLVLDINTEPVSLGNCPLCGGEVVRNRFGNFGCSNWKSGCKFTINGTICGKKLTDANVKALLTKGQTQELYGFTAKKGNKFDAKLVLSDDGKVNFSFVDHPKKR